MKQQGKLTPFCTKALILKCYYLKMQKRIINWWKISNSDSFLIPQNIQCYVPVAICLSSRNAPFLKRKVPVWFDFPFQEGVLRFLSTSAGHCPSLTCELWLSLCDVPHLAGGTGWHQPGRDLGCTGSCSLAITENKQTSLLLSTNLLSTSQNLPSFCWNVWKGVWWLFLLLSFPIIVCIVRAPKNFFTKRDNFAKLFLNPQFVPAHLNLQHHCTGHKVLCHSDPSAVSIPPFKTNFFFLNAFIF